jgi:Ca2+-binding RTX toxin-like protein
LFELEKMRGSATAQETAMPTTGFTTAPTEEYPLQQMYFYGTNTNDTIYLSTRDGVALYALDGADYVEGNGANNVIYGGAGEDWLEGKGGNDFLYGGEDNDQVFGNEGKDHLYGGGDQDFLSGGANEDRLWGGSGQDLLQGDADNDVLWGGAGVDVLEGGAGADQFRFYLNDTGDMYQDKADEITDFDDTDTIWLQGQYTFAGDNFDNPADGMFTIWQGAADWGVTYAAGGEYHDIIVSSDPHGQIGFF